MMLLKQNYASVAPYQPENNNAHYLAYYRKLLHCEAKYRKL